jgi:hypothetical protein
MIQVTDIRICDEGDCAVLSSQVRSEEPRLNGGELWIRYPREYRECLSVSADPWIALLLWPAMRLGHRLVVDAEGSSKLMEAVATLMSIMHCWDERYRPIEVQTQGSLTSGDAGTAVATFFSGGVDSFYTVLKHSSSVVPAGERLTHLISVHGLDVRLDDRTLWTRVRGRLSDAATHLGCSWVECATNLRTIVSDEMVPWQMHYGAVLAGVAMGLPGLWRKVLIPADQTYADMFPSGSHPLVDPLWSTESLRVVNDGAEATRIQKIQWQIAKSDAALRHLRVCWENRNGDYNCCECEKCIRTMISLKIAGVLDRCESFPRPLNYRRVAQVRFTSAGQRVLMVQNYQAAKAVGLEPALVHAIGRCLDASFSARLRRGLYRRAERLVAEARRFLFGRHSGQNAGSEGVAGEMPIRSVRRES